MPNPRGAPKGQGKGVVNRRQDDMRYNIEVTDLGHSKICYYCGKAHGLKYALIGKPRDLDIEDCETCKIAPFVQKKRHGEATRFKDV